MFTHVHPGEMIQFDEHMCQMGGKKTPTSESFLVRNAILDLTFSKVFKVRKSKYLESSHA